MDKVAIIPARGGSKRIPRKNIREFCGKPVIAYSIAAALESKMFARVIVSTEDPEIAEVASRYGAEVPFLRPAELADDQTGLLPVLQHALQWLRSQGQSVDYICSILATAPLVDSRTMVSAFEAMVSASGSGATTVTSFPACVFRAFRISAAKTLEMVWPENYLKRSQDFPEVYHDAGQFTWLRVRDFPEDPDRLPENIVPVIVPRFLVQDIDTPEDWERAEQIYRLLHGLDCLSGGKEGPCRE